MCKVVYIAGGMRKRCTKEGEKEVERRDGRKGVDCREVRKKG